MGEKQEGNQLLAPVLLPPMGPGRQTASLRGKLGVRGIGHPAGMSVAVLFGSGLKLGLMPHTSLGRGEMAAAHQLPSCLIDDSFPSVAECAWE